MTKIAISPNPNGTGTFTVAAPDSNTDRTLTLPDAGGEVFSQGNILGTVSQSAGDPTGAIIQRGSNANGEFVRFADGTMLAHMERTSTAANPQVWTYPAEFISTPRIMTQAVNLGNRTVGIASITTTSLEYSRYIADTGGNSTVPVMLFAIGRWF